MKGHSFVTAIYGQMNYQGKDKFYWGHFLYYLLDDDGPLDRSAITTLMKQWLKSSVFSELEKVEDFSSTNQLGPFENLEKMKDFLTFLCDELKYQEVYLVSQDVYNTILIDCNNRDELWAALQNGGEKLIIQSSKKRGLWDRIFTP